MQKIILIVAASIASHTIQAMRYELKTPLTPNSTQEWLEATPDKETVAEEMIARETLATIQKQQIETQLVKKQGKLIRSKNKILTLKQTQAEERLKHTEAQKATEKILKDARRTDRSLLIVSLLVSAASFVYVSLPL